MRRRDAQTRKERTLAAIEAQFTRAIEAQGSPSFRRQRRDLSPLRARSQAPGRQGRPALSAQAVAEALSRASHPAGLSTPATGANATVEPPVPPSRQPGENANARGAEHNSSRTINVGNMEVNTDEAVRFPLNVEQPVDGPRSFIERQEIQSKGRYMLVFIEDVENVESARIMAFDAGVQELLQVEADVISSKTLGELVVTTPEEAEEGNPLFNALRSLLAGELKFKTVKNVAFAVDRDADNAWAGDVCCTLVGDGLRVSRMITLRLISSLENELLINPDLWDAMANCLS